MEVAPLPSATALPADSERTAEFIGQEIKPPVEAKDIIIGKPITVAIDAPALLLPKREDSKFWAEFGMEIRPRNPRPIEWDGDSATHFDRHPSHGIACTVSQGAVAIASLYEDANVALGALCQRLSTSRPFAFAVEGLSYFLYRSQGFVDLPDGLELPEGVRLFRAGDDMPLPSHDEFQRDNYWASGIADLQEISTGHLGNALQHIPDPVVENSPLAAFSLRGQAAKFERLAVQARPLLDDVCTAGEATVWYGPPNAGKTLIGIKLLSEALREGRLAAGNVYYINADDSSSGFALKMRLMDDCGVHTLSPGQLGFRAADLAELLQKMATDRKARGVLVIIDTLKKFVDLMAKRESTNFADACRQFVMAGGTLLAFAHTNKNASASGKLMYAGTADIMQDFDAAYVMTPLQGIGDGSETVVEFDPHKGRGGGGKVVAYAYSRDADISYAERLASVRRVEPEQLDSFQMIEAARDSAEIIAAIKDCITADINKKMDLAKAASEKAQVSERAAIRTIEKFTGSDPERHHWTYRVKERGAKVFELLANSRADPAPAPD